MTAVVAQDNQLLLNETTPPFQLHLCLILISPNYAFMRRRLTSKRKVKYKYQQIDVYIYQCGRCPSQSLSNKVLSLGDAFLKSSSILSLCMSQSKVFSIPNAVCDTVKWLI